MSSLKGIQRVGLSSAHVCLEHSANLGPNTATRMIGGTMFKVKIIVITSEQVQF